mgnify:CR=1 FL=1
MSERVNVGADQAEYIDPKVHAVALAWQERHNFDLQRLDNWIEQQCGDDLRDLVRGRRDLAIACEVAGNVDAVYFALAYFQTQIKWHSEHTVVMPYAAKGARFKPGRPKGSISPVRAALRKFMAKHPKATAAEAWEAFKIKPPTGCRVHEGWGLEYISDGKTDTSYARFANLVSEERPKKQTAARRTRAP